MPLISPSAAVLISAVQNGKTNRSDGGVFLELLNGGGASSGLDSASGGQSLVDLLYSDDGSASPLPGIDAQRSDSGDSDDSKVLRGFASDEVDYSKAPPSAIEAKREIPARNNYREREDSTRSDGSDLRRSADIVAANTKANSKSVIIRSSAEKKNTDKSSDEIESLSQKIRAKLNDLSDLLAALASSLGLGGAVQISTFKVTTITISAEGQYFPGYEQGGDLSAGFKQLLAAVSSGEYIPDDARDSLRGVFSAFSDFLDSATTSGFSLDSAQCTFCATKIDIAVGSVSAIAADFSAFDKGAVAADLRALAGWLGDLRSLAASLSSTVENSAITAVSEASVLPIAQLKNADTEVASSLIDSANKNLPADNNQIFSTNSKNAENYLPTANIVTSTQPAAAVTAPAVAAQTAQAIAAISEGGQGGEGDLSHGNSGNGNSQQGGYGSNISPGATASAGNLAKISADNSLKFSKLLNETNRPPLAEQVVFNIKTAVKEGSSTIHIQLDPAELGKLRISLDLSADGKASGVVVVADNKNTLNLLQRDAAGLERALADAGIKMDSGSMSFNLQGGNQQQQQQQETRQQYAAQKLPEYSSPLVEEDEIAKLSAVVSRNYAVNINDGLDIKI